MGLLNDLIYLAEKKVENFSADVELKKLKAQKSLRNLLLSIVFGMMMAVLGIFVLVHLSGACQAYLTEVTGRSYYGSLLTALVFIVLLFLVFFLRNHIFLNLFRWIYKIFDQQ